MQAEDVANVDPEQANQEAAKTETAEAVKTEEVMASANEGQAHSS